MFSSVPKIILFYILFNKTEITINKNCVDMDGGILSTRYNLGHHRDL